MAKIIRICFRWKFQQQSQLLSLSIRSFHVISVKCCNDLEPKPSKVVENPQRKILKVGIFGRPNAGKSTLINSIMNLNVCDASPKTHTTIKTMKTAFVKGDTQIIFVDTPGLVTRKEYQRFGLSKTFRTWYQRFFNEVDMVALIQDAEWIESSLIFHSVIKNIINVLPESLPIVLLMNKTDKVINYKELVSRSSYYNNNPDFSDPKYEEWKRFSKIFFISALKNKGVSKFVNYLVNQAKEGEWEFEPGKIFDKPLHILINDLLRAKTMAYLVEEIPHNCTYEVEYLNENSVGEIVCRATITCKEKHVKFFLNPKDEPPIKKISSELESDLYYLTKKTFRLWVTVVPKEKN